MKKRFLLLFFLFLSSFVQEVRSKQPGQWEHSLSHRYYGVRQGLGQTQAFHLFQDHHGYLWISHDAGVDRFDGIAFRHYSETLLQMGKIIFHICQYADTMFFASTIGISVLYPNDSTHFIPYPDNLSVMDIANVNCFYSDENTLYISNLHERNETNYHGKASIYKFDLRTKVFTLIADRQYMAVIAKSGDKIFVFSNITYDSDHPDLQIYRLENDRIELVQTIGRGKEFVDGGNFFRDCTGCLFWLRNSPLYSDISELTPDGNDHFRITPLFQLPKEYFVYIFSIDDQTIGFSKMAQPMNYAYSLRDRTIRPLPINSLFIRHAIRDRDGRLWLATEDGVYGCNRLEFETFQLGLAKNDNIWSVLHDRDGNTWFSTYGNGLWMAKPDGTLHRAVNSTVPIIDGYTGNTTDRKGRIWLTSGDGLLCYRPGKYDSGKLIRRGAALIAYYDSITDKVYASGNHEQTRDMVAVDMNLRDTVISLGQQFIISISRDGNRRLRIGTFADQYYLDEITQTIVRDTTPRPYVRGIIAMALDSEGTLWKSTQDGVFAENLQGTDTLIYHKNKIYFMLCWSNKYIIFGGVGAELFILDLQAFHRQGRVRIRSFTYYDGFDIFECGQNGASIDPDGYVWIVGGDRVIKFHPDTLMTMPEPALSQPYIVTVSSSHRDGSWHVLDMEQPVRLANDANFLKFDILQAALNAPDSLRFRYRLLGYNEDWTFTASPPARSFTFQNVPFGTYRLEIQSSLGNDVWSASVFSPDIHINAPFWLTAPGLLLLGLMLAILVYFLFQMVQRRIALKQKEAQEIEQMRFHAVQHKFIPHFTRNVLNSVNYLMVKDPEKARMIIDEFATFSNETLLNSERFFWSLDEEVEYARRYLLLEQIRFSDRLKFHFDIDSTIDMKMNVPMMILHTFCDNALKHGLRHKAGDWLVITKIYREGGAVVISVEDNGIGRTCANEISTEGTREGIKILEKQLEFFKRANNKTARLSLIDLHDTDGQAIGTRSEIRIGD